MDFLENSIRSSIFVISYWNGEKWNKLDYNAGFK